MPNSAIQNNSVSRTNHKGSVPQVEVKFRVDFDSFPKGSTFAIPYWSAEVQLAGVPVPTGSLSMPNPMFFDADPPRAQGEFSFRMFLYPYIIEAINSARPGDVPGSAQVWFHYVESYQAGDGRWHVRGLANAPAISLDYSRDEWNTLLDDVGYEGAWIVEVVRPTTSGWEEVEGKLREADKELRNMQAQRAATASREAWELAKPFIQQKWEPVQDIINRGSKSPGKYTTKADRVASIYNDIDLLFNDVRYLADIGAHGGVHSMSDEDATLIYRLSHSILAYLSRRMREVQPAGPPKA